MNHSREKNVSVIRPVVLTHKRVVAFLKPRPSDSHKGMFGKVTVIGGEAGMVGAALLAGRAALKLGSGCVYVGLLANNAPPVDWVMPELMLLSADAALKSTQPTVLVIGCGLGQSLAAQNLLYDALVLDVPTVVDADALNLLALRPDFYSLLQARKTAAVFTPHPGEAARLLGCKIEEIQGDRSGAALELTRKLSGNVVLKGAQSLCATHEGKLYLNKTGNPGMSSAGMGDVLSGMIAAFIAQGLSADQALLLGVHLHGAAGDALAAHGTMKGMSASELIESARFLHNQWSL
jgi:hydroxyethylthiazole kinase-like uncharacterized protein yjeF